MQLLTLFLIFITLATAAVKNTTREYQLQTQLKPGQPKKSRYNGLWLSSYHTGAGENDVVFQTMRASSSKGFLNATNTTSAGGHYNQLFDLGNDFAWGFLMDANVNFYAAWEPVRMNAGVSGSDYDVSGFFINKTGLQWTSAVGKPGGASDSFGGWLVCNWWHGVPQLFFRSKYYKTPAPLSCADVNLVPRYI